MESEPQGLCVSWVNSNIQAFNDILDAAILTGPVCGEDVEVTERFSLSLPLSLSLSFECSLMAAGCIIGLDAAMPLMQCPPYQLTGTHFADLRRMTTG